MKILKIAELSLFSKRTYYFSRTSFRTPVDGSSVPAACALDRQFSAASPGISHSTTPVCSRGVPFHRADVTALSEALQPTEMLLSK